MWAGSWNSIRIDTGSLSNIFFFKLLVQLLLYFVNDYFLVEVLFQVTLARAYFEPVRQTYLS